MSEPKTNNPLAVCRPLADRLVVRRDLPQTVTPGGIMMPDTFQGRQQTGTVISAGPGRRDEKGNRVPMDVKVGDRVVLTGYAGLEIRDPGVEHEEEYTILREEDIVAVLPV
jgi:chaperonin GroES